MGTYYESVVVIGCLVPASKIIVNERARGCAHQETDTKFCAECGARMWETKPVHKFRSDGYVGHWPNRGPYHVTASIDDGDAFDIPETKDISFLDEKILVGKVVGDHSFTYDDDPGKVNVLSIEGFYGIEERLKRAGIFDQESFGMWVQTIAS